MIALPEGVTVYAHGREWVGEIPAELCPDHLKPTDDSASAPGKIAPKKDAPGV